MAKLHPGPLPVHWSHTRETTLRTCARRYYYRYVLARGGWNRDAPQPVRHAFMLAQLTDCHRVLGLALHALAAECARRIVDRAPPLSVAVMRQRARAALNLVYRNGRNSGAFRSDPVGHPMLAETYYGRELAPETVDRVRTKLDRCTTHLAETDVWGDLSACAASSIRVIDAPLSFCLGQITVWGAPDLVFVSADGVPIILDWKTGSAPAAEAAEQLGTYAVLAHNALGLPVPEAGYDAQLALLSSGSRVGLPIGLPDLDVATCRIAAGARSLSEADSAARPGSFPRTDDPRLCQGCSFSEICERDPRDD